MEYTDNQYAREASQIEKTSMNKSKSFTKTFSQLFFFFFFSFFIFFFPRMFMHLVLIIGRERDKYALF